MTKTVRFFLLSLVLFAPLPAWGQSRPLADPLLSGPTKFSGLTSSSGMVPGISTGSIVKSGSGSIAGVNAGSPPYPPSMQWKQITTPRHRFIFPEGFEEEASRVASMAMDVWPKIEEGLNTEMPPLPIILNTTKLVSNGYATLAPRRSEWYGVNSQGQFAGPVDWYTLLALHEGRHASQFDALHRGFTRFAGYAAGEYGWSFFSMYSVPLWFFEGDAIMAETLFSEAGRGGSASFHRELRAILEDDIDLSYSQAYLGSYRSHFPSHYHLGYPLVAYVRRTYGQESWREILRRTSRFSFWPLQFHRAVKKVTGRSMTELYGDALEYYRSRFTSDSDGFETNSTLFADLPASGWTNYLPIAGDGAWDGAGEGGFFAVRHGDEYPWALVRVEPGSPELSHGSQELESNSPETASGGKMGKMGKVESITPLPAGERFVSVSGGLAVWTENIRHPLWSGVSSSRIVRYDLESGKRRILTGGRDKSAGEEDGAGAGAGGNTGDKGTRGSYQAPSLSPGGERIAAVYALPGGGAELRILSSDTGEVLAAFLPGGGEKLGGAAAAPAADNLAERAQADTSPDPVKDPPVFILQPAWSPDGRRVAAVEVCSGSSSIVEYDTAEGAEGSVRTLLGPVKETLSMPVYFRDYILYVSEGGGKERIEALHPKKGQRYAAASGAVAASSPVPVLSKDGEGDILVFADYSTAGFRPAYTDLDPEDFVLLSDFSDESGSTVDYDGEKIRTRDEFEVESYDGASRFINFHSWGIVPAGEGRAELFVRSDDVLGLLSLRPFAGLNIRNKTWDTGLEGVYRGIYPLIRFRVSADTFRPADPDRRRNGLSGQLGVEAPVDISRGVWHRQLSFGTTGFIRYLEEGPVDVVIDPSQQEYFTMPVSHSAAFYRASKAFAPIDFAPPLEQFFRGVWLHMPFGMDQNGGRLVSEGYLTFPGVGAHHRFRITGGGEWKYGKRVPLSYPTAKPRGYTSEWGDAYEFNATAGLEYQLPLSYPDLEMGHVYYLKRIRGTLFTELGAGMRKDEDSDETGLGSEEAPVPWRTAWGAELFPVSGLELFFEQHFFSWPVVFEGGIRLLYRWGDGAFRLEDTVFTLGFEW